MRLYTRTGATALDDQEFGHFDADDQGGFDLPDELSDRIGGFAHRGKPIWETDVQRQGRLMAEERERASDPATLLAAVQQLVKAAQTVAPAADPAPVAKRPGRRSTAAE